MIRIAEDHPTRKEDPFVIKQKIMSIAGTDKAVRDVWPTRSGFAVLANSPAQAATIVAKATQIENAIGSAKVERQEKWTTFIVGPIPKRIRTLEGMMDPVAGGLLTAELQPVSDAMPIRRMEWTNRSKDPGLLEGHIRICVPQTRASKFPIRMRIFARPVSTQRITAKQPTLQCGRCHGFHPERLCARILRCSNCGEAGHQQDFTKPARCLNCRGPHGALDTTCPARPKRKDGHLARPSRPELRAIRSAGGRACAQRDRHSVPSTQNPDCLPDQTPPVLC